MIKINNKNYNEVLVVNINDKEYNLPLIKYLPYKCVKKLTKLQETQDIESLIDVMSDYIPREVLEDLSIMNISEIMEAWSKEQNNEDTNSVGN